MGVANYLLTGMILQVTPFKTSSSEPGILSCNVLIRQDDSDRISDLGPLNADLENLPHSGDIFQEIELYHTLDGRNPANHLGWC